MNDATLTAAQEAENLNIIIYLFILMMFIAWIGDDPRYQIRGVKVKLKKLKLKIKKLARKINNILANFCSDIELKEKNEFNHYIEKIFKHFNSIDVKYKDKLSKLEVEILAIPNIEEFIEYKKNKKEVLEQLKTKIFLEKLEYLKNLKEKLPVFIIVDNISKFNSNDEIKKMYRLLATKYFNKKNIKFITSDYIDNINVEYIDQLKNDEIFDDLFEILVFEKNEKLNEKLNKKFLNFKIIK